MLEVSRQKNGKTPTPTWTGNFLLTSLDWERIGNSTRRYCYRDATPTNVFCKDMKGTIEVSYAYMVHFQMVLQKFNFFHWSCLCNDFGCLFSLLNYMGSPQSKTKLLCVESKF